MQLVINSLGGTHTYTHTQKQTHTHTHTDNPHRINFKKPGADRPAFAWFKNVAVVSRQHKAVMQMAENYLEADGKQILHNSAHGTKCGGTPIE